MEGYAEYESDYEPEVIDADDRPHKFWICEECGAQNSHLDAECQYH
jgi:hypothetical protein